MNDYVLTRQARTDLKGIWRYSADQWSSEQADRYIRKIHEAITATRPHPIRDDRAMTSGWDIGNIGLALTSSSTVLLMEGSK
jgi:plasmid stabilization system protein ParE